MKGCVTVIPLEKEFTKELFDNVAEMKQYGYNPTIYMRMISENGAVNAAKKLVMQDVQSSGFATLIMINKLELSVEASVIKDKYKDLFTDAEIQNSIRKLKEADYSFNN